MSSHDFDRELLARYYDEYETCLYCHKSGADCFHHAIPRARPYTDSPFNATPLHNYDCNIAKHGEIHKPEHTQRFIETNIRRLIQAGYDPVANDVLFIKTHAPELL